MAGSVAANLHEGSRSEYLAQYIFASFGTSVPVPHQEDSGIDLYCTLTERVGQRAWARAHYAVQVKSSMDPWVLESEESIRWLIEHRFRFSFASWTRRPPAFASITPPLASICVGNPSAPQSPGVDPHDRGGRTVHAVEW